MPIILSFLFLTILIVFVSEKFYTVKNYAGSREIKDNFVSKVYFTVAILILTMISGLRSNIGDTGYYMYDYINISNSSFVNIIDSKDWGFYFFQYILGIFIKHPQTLLISSAFITIFFILKTLKKNSEDFVFSFFLFITAGAYFATMNGLRQYLASAIFFYFFPLIKKDKKIKFLILILLLSTIHESILVMIPVYFIVREKAWSKRICLLFLASIAGVVLFSSLFGYFSIFLNSINYGGYIKSFGDKDYGGANVLRIAFNGLPVVMGFIYRDIMEKKEKKYNIYMNFSLLNFIFYLFSYYNWIFARYGIYFDLFNLLLIPSIVKNVFREKERLLVMFILIVLYLIFFSFEIRNMNYASYYLDINRNVIGSLVRLFYNW